MSKKPPQACSVQGCERENHARTLCRKHYQQAAKHGQLSQYPKLMTNAEIIQECQHLGLDITQRIVPQLRNLAPLLKMSDDALIKRWDRYKREENTP